MASAHDRDGPLPPFAGGEDTREARQARLVRSKFARALWMCAGFACVGLGMLGIVLPGLPTTPFMLLAAACFYRSSQRFYDWLIDHPRFGHYVRDYREGRGIPARVKPIAMGSTAIFAGYAVLWGIPEHLLWARGVTAVAGIVGFVWVARLPNSGR